MAEVITPVEMVKIEYKCDVEGCTGEMLSTNIMLPSSPPHYPHRCNVCATEMTFAHAYPRSGYRGKQ
jgi:hypothetical protein